MIKAKELDEMKDSRIPAVHELRETLTEAVEHLRCLAQDTRQNSGPAYGPVALEEAEDWLQRFYGEWR